MLKVDAELKALIPPLTAEEFDQLEKNILAEGIREPVITWWYEQEEQIIIDGHNRHEIATKHGIPYKTVLKEFDSREQVIEWMILNQFGRRNLSAYQRSLLALKLKPVVEEQSKERMLSGNPVPKSEQGKTIEKIAKVAGVGKDTIAKVQKIEEKAPEKVKEQIKSGEISINQAYQQVRKQEKIEKVEEKISQAKTNSTGFINIYDTDKKYNIIYADPAWSYTDWGNGTRNPDIHYKTMTIEDICNLPVKDISDDDSILFLWVTYPLLQDCFKVIESWGFEYKTAGFVWIKKNKVNNDNFFGCGSWTRANSELCLIATKGKVLRLDASISQIIEMPIEEHSKKPDIVRKYITELVGELPRIELFSRQTVEGWDCWGNEI